MARNLKPVMIFDLTPAMIERFRRLVQKTDYCWRWQGNISPQGYGKFCVGGIPRNAHRIAFFLANGYLAPVLDHLCRNRACVNPAHLEPVTTRENVLRGISPLADNYRKTHCVNGHPLSLENTRVRLRKGTDRRLCKTCQRAWYRKWVKSKGGKRDKEKHRIYCAKYRAENGDAIRARKRQTYAERKASA